MADKNSVDAEMSEIVADQLSVWVREASEPALPGEHINQRIRRSATRLGLSEGQAKRAWYREWRRVPADLYLSVQSRMHEIADEQARLVRAQLQLLETKRRAYERDKAAVADLFERRDRVGSGGDV